MRPFLALVSTDLRLFFKDRRAVLMSVVAPIVIASFFGFVFGGDEGDRKPVSRVALDVVDEDGSQLSRALTARLAGDQALDVAVVPLAQAREDVRRAKRIAAIHLPAGFGATAASAFFGGGTKAPVDLLYDPSHGTEAAMIEGVLAGHVMAAVSKEMFSGPMGKQAVRDSLVSVERSEAIAPREKGALLTLLRGVQGWNDVAAGGAGTGTGVQGGLTIPYELKKSAVTSSSSIPYNAYAHAFAGMGVQFILFMGIEMGVGLLTQRRQGLWKRLRAAPLSRATLLGSRAVSTALISLFILAGLFLFAGVVFGVRISGSVAGFVGICTGFSLMTAAFGLLLAGLGKTPEGTRGISIVVTLLLVMLGGAWVPTFVFPAWMQRLTLVVPTRWAIDGLDGTTWRGLGFSDVAVPIACLALTALACGALAVARFRWETE
jgi:ABC-2 type transport system permease protein